MLGQELFDEFQERFLTLDRVGPKVSCGNIRDSEETDVMSRLFRIAVLAFAPVSSISGRLDGTLTKEISI